MRCVPCIDQVLINEYFDHRSTGTSTRWCGDDRPQWTLPTSLHYTRGVGAVTDYLTTIDGPDAEALARVYRIAREVVPGTDEGISYSMPALLYRGKALVSTMRAKKFLSLYPFSGSVVASVKDELGGWESTTGSIHYSASNPIPTETLARILDLRRAEIDSQNPR
jgi:uncharacterized protein YdhG (YjbR/CyaY superfamily)